MEKIEQGLPSLIVGKVRGVTERALGAMLFALLDGTALWVFDRDGPG